VETEEQLIIYTDHALGRMSVRGVTKEMVKDTLANPEQTGVGYKSRFLAYKSFGNRRIKVIYTKEGKRFVIISVIWD